jgi:hypothetical protein
MPPTWALEEMEASVRQQLEDERLKKEEAMETCQPSSKGDTTTTSTARESSKVQFDLEDATQVHEITSRSELTPDDVEAIWYVKSDYQAINSWIRVTVKNMKKKLPEEGEELGYCYRGLEQRVNPDRRRDTVIESIYAVLREQSRQRKLETPPTTSTVTTNPDLLSKVYRSYSIACQLESYKLAKKDARKAAMIQNPPPSPAAPIESPTATTSTTTSRRKGTHSKATRRNSFLMEAEDVDVTHHQAVDICVPNHHHQPEQEPASRKTGKTVAPGKSRYIPRFLFRRGLERTPSKKGFSIRAARRTSFS